MTVDQLLERIARVVAREPRVRFALLFGSAATRGPDAAEDIDIALSLAAGCGREEQERLASGLEAGLRRDVDLVDLAEGSTLLRWEVARTGLPVPGGDALALTCFRARASLEYLDLEPLLELEAAGLRRRLGVGA